MTTEPTDEAIERAMRRRPLGRTGLTVTPVCMGGSPIGNMPQSYGYETPEERAVQTILAAFESRINFLDTAWSYGDSEQRIGEAIRRRGGLPEGFVVETKVDPDPRTNDYSVAQVRRACEESLARLGLERVPLLYLHDPEFQPDPGAMLARGGAVDELVKLREEGFAEHLGLAGGSVEVMRRFLDSGVFEVLISHNRWTLLDRSAGELFDHARSMGVAVVNGAPFGGGILATGVAGALAVSGRTAYAYSEARPELLERVRRMDAVCAEASVPLAAAALQFSMRDPRISSTIVGLSRPERIAETERLAAWPIPGELWDRLEALAMPRETWLF